MLHELLLALVGFTGDFIVEDAAASPPKSPFRLAADISFLQPPERAALERLLPLGFYYRELNRFSNLSRGLSSEDSASPGKGRSLYGRAVANGVAEILSLYRSAVLQVEQNLLADPIPILAAVTAGLSRFGIILPPLYELIVEVERKDIKGGVLLNLLRSRCRCGVPELQCCFQRLLWHGHRVMYNQLASWMVHGILHDPYEEFFIVRHSSPSDVSEGTGDAFLSNWHSEYRVVTEMLPEHIPVRIAESVLFAGKAMRVLRNPSSGCRLQDYAVQSAEELFPQSEADKIEFMIQELKHSSEFQKRLFEAAVNSGRVIAANYLWQLVFIRADLNGHLKAMKDYFLLAKGDFFQCFLEESRQLMRSPPNKLTVEADLLVPFQLAASKTIGEEDRYFSRVTLQTKCLQKEHVEPSSELDSDFWDNISLEYSVDWPLQLFFTEDVVAKYGKVFRYLIRLKRTQMELEKCWAAAMHQSRAVSADERKCHDGSPSVQLQQKFSRSMWRVRENMAFLIRNLQFYIQVDVIESQWNSLQSRVQGSHDFTELVSFHQEYLSALISQSFLDIGSLSRILDSIMKLCLQFCFTIERYEAGADRSHLDRIIEQFNEKSVSLYTILRGSPLHGSQRAPFLRQFLTRLNFNSLFEATARSSVFSARPRAGVLS